MIKKAFTMFELVIAMAIVAILALVTIPIAKHKMEKVDKFSYYLAYATVQDIAANIVAQSNYEYNETSLDEMSTSDNLDTATNLCDKIKADYNTSGYDCGISASQMRTNTSSGFSDAASHIRLSNGLNIFIMSDLAKINDLSDAVDKRDRVGYLIAVDSNGYKGKGILYQDVYPFYILLTGKVLPLYNPSGVGGANDAELLAGNILYDDYSTGNRVVKAAQTNVDYQTGICATKGIQSSKYCKSISVNSNCSNSNADCRYVINKPMKFFGR